MSSSSSIFSNIGNKKECKCRLPVMILTSWTKEHPAKRFVVCPNRYKTGVKKCNFWDWYDDDVENEWYRTHLYEMYRLLNPSQRRELETKISSQEEVVLLQLEMQTMRDELSKCQKKAFFWKSAVILFVVVWFVSSMN
ncbi:hypothetical protein Tco_1029497 [Tanacetum coccineum]|uniref:Zinc finger GRF-type domain-containing protein n=1 Tax=Tanacetum coccineum TaxID=301880 RepID=A0ABQ5G439_9ASTR